MTENGQSILFYSNGSNCNAQDVLKPNDILLVVTQKENHTIE